MSTDKLPDHLKEIIAEHGPELVVRFMVDDGMKFLEQVLPGWGMVVIIAPKEGAEGDVGYVGGSESRTDTLSIMRDILRRTEQ